MKMTKNTLQYAIDYFKNELDGVYDKSELEQLLQITFFHFFKLNRIGLTLNKDDKLSSDDLSIIEGVVHDLKQYKPLAQILGEWELFGLSLKVNEDILIPRPETEELIQLILNENNNPLSILDIGTGSGCIALAIKKNLPRSIVSAFDVSKKALDVASENARINELDITFREIDILNWKKLDEEYDLIVSNPPYIPNKEKTLMARNVLDYEPHLALFVEDDEPLLFYNTIANFALSHLKKSGKLYFEINENYGNEVKDLLIAKKFKNVNIVKDINEKDRIVSCNL